MSDINIPGVSDKYKTNDLVAGLMEAERLPLKREQDKLDSYKVEQENWRRVNQYMSSLRESVRSLYSFDNPFTNKNAISSNDGVVTAEATREASLETFKVDIKQLAAADRFISQSISKDYEVISGKYTFAVGDKEVSFNWRGGTINDFVASLNRRGNNLVKASLLSSDGKSNNILIESLKTGKENALVFKDDALNFALNTQLIQKAQSKPDVSTIDGTARVIEPQSTSTVPLTEYASGGGVLSFSAEFSQVVQEPPAPTPEQLQAEAAAKAAEEAAKQAQLASEQNASQAIAPTGPMLPDGMVSYKGITVKNDAFDANLPELAGGTNEGGQSEPAGANPNSTGENQINPNAVNSQTAQPPQEVGNPSVLYVKNTDGTESLVPLQLINGQQQISLNLSDYPLISGLEVRNENETWKVALSDIQLTKERPGQGYEPVNAVDVAADAEFMYEGIKMTRPENSIDDAIPYVTLHLQGTSDRPVNVSIENDVETSKDAIIEFVGNYNQLLAEINILTQNKPEVVAELEYFTEDEQDSATERLGSQLGDFTLNNSKQALQRIVTGAYPSTESTEMRMLSNLGIASKTQGGTASSAQLRGYLEIDEQKLDAALENNLVDIKNLFGYDTDGDLVIDTGVAYRMDTQLQPYTQIGGILATKNSGLDSKIRASETEVRELEIQIADKESQLKRTYGQMEATLNSLNSQSSAITNFSTQNSSKK